MGHERRLQPAASLFLIAFTELRRVKPGRDRHGRGWLGLQTNGAYLVTGISQAPVLPAVLVLLFALGGAVAAWMREGN